MYYSGTEALCLGERKLISKNPVRWSDSFEWQTYGTVDARRRAVGAGLYKLFQDGTLSGGALRTVGIWSRNIPSGFHALFEPNVLMTGVDRLADRRSGTTSVSFSECGAV